MCAWWLRRVRSQALLETGRVARFAATGPPQGEGVAGDVPFRDGGGSVVLVCLLVCAFVCRIDHIFDRQFRDASHVVVVSVCDRSKCECE